MNFKENNAVDRLMKLLEIEARSAADTQMVSGLLNNQTVELLQDQQYIYDYEDSQAKVRTQFQHLVTPAEHAERDHACSASSTYLSSVLKSGILYT